MFRVIFKTETFPYKRVILSGGREKFEALYEKNKTIRQKGNC